MFVKEAWGIEYLEYSCAFFVTKGENEAFVYVE